MEQATAGTFTGSVGVDLISDGGPIDGLGTVDLGTQTIAVTGTVFNYATAAVADIGTVGVFSGSGNSYTLDLGTVTQASARTQAVVEVENVATALADALTGAVAFSGTTSAFINSGVGPLGSIAAGGASTALDISLSTANTGTFTETATYTVSSTDAGGATVLTPVTIAVTGTVAAPAGTVYTLTSGVDTVNGNAGINTVIASGGALSAGDQIDGGSGGDNALVLQGAGIFNLALPATLTDIETIEAQEGQSSSVVNGVAYASSAQTVTLRAGENNVTVNVAAANINANNPSQPTITITGAANNDVINLATGNDVVTMGAGESAYGGGGNDTFLVSASTISNVVINGGTGASTLWFTGGGVVSLGSDPNITNISTLYLASAATAYTVSAGGASGSDGAGRQQDHDGPADGARVRPDADRRRRGQADHDRGGRHHVQGHGGAAERRHDPELVGGRHRRCDRAGLRGVGRGSDDAELRHQRR